MSKTRYICQKCGFSHGYMAIVCARCDGRPVADKPYEFDYDALNFQLTTNPDVYSDPELDVDDE